MIQGPQELLDSVDRLGVRFGWVVFPTRRTILQCRAETIALDDSSGNPVIEAAAMFFVFALDERRLGPNARGLLPIALALHHLHDHRFCCGPNDLGDLGWLRHQVAEGSADWPIVRAWFLERVRPRSRTGS